MRSAYAIGGGGILVFDDGEDMLIPGDLFRRQDIERLVGRIKALVPGVITEMP